MRGRERERRSEGEEGRKGGRGGEEGGSGGEGEEREGEGEEVKANFKQSLTLHLTNFFAILIVASQKAPLYLALTSVPTLRNGGSSLED